MQIAADLYAAFSGYTLLLAVLGVTLGYVFGALPGFGGGSSMAVLLPFAFAMSPLNAMVFLISVYGGTQFGGGLTSIMFGFPGDAGAAATVMDGFAMTRNGRVTEALAYSNAASFFGSVVSLFAFLLISPLLAKAALAFGPPEFFVLAVFGLTIIAALNGKRIYKSIIAGLFGVILTTVGLEHVTGGERAMWGFDLLADGLPFIPVILGFFCISQMLELAEQPSIVRQKVSMNATFSGVMAATRQGFSYFRTLTVSTVVGGFIGALPGAGASISAFVTYTIAKSTSAHPERFGRGEPEGVIAPEAGNNANVGGALIPTFTLGIPGSPACAALLGVMMFMGLRPGPQLFQEQLPLIQQLVFYLMLGLVFALILGILLTRYANILVDIPSKYVIPPTIVMAAIAAYSGRTEIIDVWIMLGCGAVGYVMNRYHYPVSSVVLGFALGSMMEEYLLESIQLSDWDLTIFFTRPISILLWLCSAAALAYSIYMARRMPDDLAEPALETALPQTKEAVR